VESEDTPGAPRAPTGTRDVLWPETWRWEQAVGRFADVVQRAGYGLLLSPLFEHASVFRRGGGESTDVVRKEMYEFADRDGKLLALRPEGTASVVRAYVQHHPTLPFKAWYVTPLFRHERPQAGRYRQHHQVGVEAIGVADADLDVEVISLATDFFAACGLTRWELRLGSLGDGTCRPGYVAALSAYLQARRATLCDEHRDRIATNPLRILDCKRPECRQATEDAPRFLDDLCDPCREHFARVRVGLQSLGIAYSVDDRLVRGWDYYTRTAFEVASSAIDAAQNALGGGGRYDGLVEMLGGEPTPGVGFGIGIERVLLACDAEGALADPAPALDAFVVDTAGGESARDLTAQLRRAGLRADRAYGGRSMKAQMRQADRSGAAVALIVGPAEEEAQTVSLRRLRAGADGAAPEGQRVLARSAVVAAVSLEARGASEPERADGPHDEGGDGR
jgi:histidyl-tRNA synthetase